MLRRLAIVALAVVGAGCSAPSAERASLDRVEVERGVDGPVLVVDQRLQFSRTMLRALTQGIPLRLDYRLHGCGASSRWEHRAALEMSFASVRRVYELRDGSGEVRRFARRSALLAALDRVRIPLDDVPAACAGQVSAALDPDALPAPLRLPAWLESDEWRMQSESRSWLAPAR